MITSKDVEYIASLARIHLTPEESLHMAQDLGRILDYVAALKQVNTDGIEPTSHVLHLKDVFREDEVRPSLGQKAALKIAVEQQAGSFKVPKVIE